MGFDPALIPMVREAGSAFRWPLRTEGGSAMQPGPELDALSARAIPPCGWRILTGNGA